MFRIVVALLIAEVFAAGMCHAQDMKISNVNDIGFGAWSMVSGVEANDTVCIYRSRGVGRYRVTATGNGTGGAFLLTSAGNTLAYTVLWGQVSATGTQLTAGVAYSTNGANTKSQTCAGTDNAQVTVRMSEPVLAAARPGGYSGSLNLLIEPD